jgi:membrane protein YqaA with SNARE-associated domain
MKAGLAALSMIFVLTVANVLVSAITPVLGTFIATSPHRAAKIWGSQRLANLAPERRASLVRWYRAFGILLCLAATLFALDSLLFSDYHH